MQKIIERKQDPLYSRQTFIDKYPQLDLPLFSVETKEELKDDLDEDDFSKEDFTVEIEELEELLYDDLDDDEFLAELDSFLLKSNFVPSSATDKVFVSFEEPFSMDLVEDFVDEKKTDRMLRSRRKAFIPTKKFSGILVLADGSQVTVWSNKSSTEFQFNGKKSSFKFIESMSKQFFPGLRPRVDRLDLSFDIKKSHHFIAEHLRIKGMKSRRTFESSRPKIRRDPKLGIVYDFNPSTEYHGKRIEYCLYDSGKFHSLGHDVARLEARYKTRRVVPVQYFDELPDLFHKKELFNNVVLPFRHDIKSLSEIELKHFRRLKNTAYRKNCSLSLAIDVLRSKNRYQADSACRALRKSEKDFFDFHSAFKVNLRCFLASKLSVAEKTFLADVKTLMLEGF